MTYAASDPCPICDHPIGEHFKKSAHPSGHARCSDARCRCFTCIDAQNEELMARMPAAQAASYRRFLDEHRQARLEGRVPRSHLALDELDE
jgi:hypothetical protein